MTIARGNTARLLLAGVAAAAVMVSGAACGSGGTTAGNGGATSPQVGAAASPSPSLAVCRDVDKIRDALHSLTPVKGALPSSTQVTAAIQDIQEGLSGLGNRTEWQSEIDNLKAAVANLETAVANLVASPGARGAAASVRTAVAQVNDSIRRLLTAVGSRCPSPSPSPSSS